LVFSPYAPMPETAEQMDVISEWIDETWKGWMKP
jgi:hypothetical protein